MERQLRWAWIVWMGWLALATFISPVNGAELTSAPILRVDPGTHTSRINDISTDSQGRWAVTASADMTARVWDAVTGELLQTLRPPFIPNADEFGQDLIQAAMSPDGDTIALAGHVGRTWDDTTKTYIFLFRRATGQMLRRLDLPLVSRQWWSGIAALRFSPDGRRLAVGLEHEGVRLLEVDTGREIGRDPNWPNIHSVDFSPDGNLLLAVTSSYVPSLRARVGVVLLYDAAGPVLVKRMEVNSSQLRLPVLLNQGLFSPDGRSIAVIGEGPEDAFAVLDSATLRVQWVPDIRGITRGYPNLDLIGWTADGRLVATGAWEVRGNIQLRIWSPGGRRFNDVPIGPARAFDLRALPDGRMLFATFDAGWGILAADGNSIQFRSVTRKVSFRSNESSLDTSPDGRRVQFRLHAEDPNPVVFDLDQAGFSPGDAHTRLQPPAPGLNFDLRDANTVRLNGRPLNIKMYTTDPVNPSCLYVASDRRHFALCTRGQLLYYDVSGRELWNQPAPGGMVDQVVISLDGRWVIAGCEDGTVRWYRSTDGAEQLALFADPAGKRWVLWTPAGFYSAGPGSEDLVGWHVNRTKYSAADWYPLSRFRERYYRPDVIARVIPEGDSRKAVQFANAQSGRPAAFTTPPVQNILPPAVTIISSLTQSLGNRRQVRLRLAIRTPADAPVTVLRVRVNGVVAGDIAAHDPGTDAQGQFLEEITLPLPDTDAVVQIFASNKNSTSPPALLQVLADHATRPPTHPAEPKGALYVLAIGVSQYNNPQYRLQFAAADASDFSAAMQSQKGGLYRAVEVRVLTDAAATRQQVIQGLDWLRQKVTVQDVGMVLLAGHAINDRLGTYYYAAADFNLDSVDRTGVPFSEIKRALVNVAGRAVFFVDTCHSGNVLGGRRADVTGMINDLSSAENAVVVLSASTGTQDAQENSEWGHGAFTKAILEGLDGRADYNRTGRITLKAMDLYLSQRVEELTKREQTPVIIAPYGLADFQIATVQAGRTPNQ